MNAAGLEEVRAFMREMEAQPLHVTHVTQLALQLFDGLVALHGLGEWERGLLETAGYLHDIVHLEANGPVLLEVITAQMKGDLAREVFERELVFMLGEEVIKR